MTLSCDVFIIIICSLELSFLIIKTNAMQQIEENTRCRHAARAKPHSRGKPSQGSSFSRFKMRHPRPLQHKLETTSIKSSLFHCVCIPRSLSLCRSELDISVVAPKQTLWDLNFLMVIASRLPSTDWTYIVDTETFSLWTSRKLSHWDQENYLLKCELLSWWNVKISTWYI